MAQARAGKQQRIFLKMRPKARRKLKRRLHTHGRVGITIVAHMRSAAGTRTAKRRIVMRTYKKTDRRRRYALRGGGGHQSETWFSCCVAVSRRRSTAWRSSRETCIWE